MPISTPHIVANGVVRDPDYWGLPVGTPIEPGMNPNPEAPSDSAAATTIEGAPPLPDALADLSEDDAEALRDAIHTALDNLRAILPFTNALYEKSDVIEEAVLQFLMEAEAKSPEVMLAAKEYLGDLDAMLPDVPTWPGPEIGRTEAEGFDWAASEWRSGSFYSHVEDWRDIAREVQREGFSEDDWSDDPESLHYLIPARMVSAIANSPATDAPILRGMRLSPDEAAQYERGTAFTMGISSFTSDEEMASGFAADPSQYGLNRDVSEDKTQPVVLRVLPGARAAVVDGATEFVSMGQFEVADVSESDGVKYVDITQTTPLEAQ
ncbi:ADP-ribosyltransferase [Gordonia phage Stormageddon]|uniref:ADP-ribosyltransferase n=1 Tax=Gordonia phage Stormageddon TaxID=2656541 RepID=A0A649VSF6_9CAUD|nr:ADP-ribosyltransferase [Gordonia phage Stormageddon]QGJ94882.1 ADP-ribosyltransferase [Gordonia phage Stormageddon]